MATDLYANLQYEEYKKFEQVLSDYAKYESTMVGGDDRYYHKFFRLRIGDINLEVHGPTVKSG